LTEPAGVAPMASLVPVRIVADRGEVGEITVELAATSACRTAIRVRIPPGCDETSIRHVLGAAVAVGEGG